MPIRVVPPTTMILSFFTLASLVLAQTQLESPITSLSVDFMNSDLVQHQYFDNVEVTLDFALDVTVASSVQPGDYFEFTVDGDMRVDQYTYDFQVLDASSGAPVFDVTSGIVDNQWTFRATATDYFLENQQAVEGALVIEFMTTEDPDRTSLDVAVGDLTETLTYVPLDSSNLVGPRVLFSSGIDPSTGGTYVRMMLTSPVEEGATSEYQWFLADGLGFQTTDENPMDMFYIDSQAGIVEEDPVDVLRKSSFGPDSQSVTITNVPGDPVAGVVITDMVFANDPSQSLFCTWAYRDSEDLVSTCYSVGSNNGFPGGSGSVVAAAVVSSSSSSSSIESSSSMESSSSSSIESSSSSSVESSSSSSSSSIESSSSSSDESSSSSSDVSSSSSSDESSSSDDSSSSSSSSSAESSSSSAETTTTSESSSSPSLASSSSSGPTAVSSSASSTVSADESTITSGRSSSLSFGESSSVPTAIINGTASAAGSASAGSASAGSAGSTDSISTSIAANAEASSTSTTSFASTSPAISGTGSTSPPSPSTTLTTTQTVTYCQQNTCSQTVVVLTTCVPVIHTVTTCPTVIDGKTLTVVVPCEITTEYGHAVTTEAKTEAVTKATKIATTETPAPTKTSTKPIETVYQSIKAIESGSLSTIPPTPTTPSTPTTIAALPTEATIKSVIPEDDSTTTITGTVVVTGTIVTSTSARADASLFDSTPSTVSQANSAPSLAVGAPLVPLLLFPLFAV